MFTHTIWRSATLLTFIFFLTACGGSSNNQPDPPVTYTVTASASTGGSVSPTSRTVTAGQTTTFTVSANEGYEIAQVTGCNGALSGNTYTTGVINASCSVNASFQKKIYSIETEVNMGGEWSPTSAEVEHGEVAEFTLSWESSEFRLLATEGCSGTFAAPTFTTGSVTAACTVSAVFEANIPPQCDAGSDQTVPGGSEVTVPGSGSDEDGEIVEYFWEQLSGPTVEIIDPTLPTLVFVAPFVEVETTLVFRLTVTDNDGATASDDVTITVYPVVDELDEIELVINDIPNQYETVEAYLLTELDMSDVDWQVYANDSVSISYTSLNNGNGIQFNADVTGVYQVTATSNSGLSEKTIAFLVLPYFAFDSSQLAGFDGSVPLESFIGVVENQAWVSSWSLNQSELESIVSQYTAFNIIGYSQYQGLLVEFEPSQMAALEALEELRLEQGVAGVNQRVYVGPEADISFFNLPDDGASWGDGGSNWHLEAGAGADFVGAWQTTTGNHQVQVGVLDSGYFVNHEELVGSYKYRYTLQEHSHGTAVAAAIVGNTDNQVGVSATNWKSPAIYGRYNLVNYLTMTLASSWDDSYDVRVINNSWGAMGNNSSAALGFAMTRTYRSVAQLYDNILHVWAAGNDGASAAQQNGAIHLNNLGAQSVLDNVLVVAAHGADGHLLPYSNYGNLIDIAAPSEYLSAKDVDQDGESRYYTSESYGECFSGGFNGTSAAAPLISGAASLVYSLYPDFKASEVKDILVSSATDAITHRRVGCGSESMLVELAHPIPKLNANAALQLAQEILNGKVTLSHYIPNPFASDVEFAISSLDAELAVDSVSFELRGRDSSEGDWNSVSSGSSQSNILQAALNHNYPWYELTANVTLRNVNSGNLVAVDKTYSFAVQSVRFITRNTVTLLPVVSAELTLERVPGFVYSTFGYTDSNGVRRAFLDSADYRVYATASNYQSTAFNHVATTGFADVYLNMTSTSAGAVGSLSGTVRNEEGLPIAGASVRISGGSLTNGYFASAVTNDQGQYVISNISKVAANGQPIESFTMEVSASGYRVAIRESVIVLQGKDRNENFTLIAFDLDSAIVYADDFETESGWQASGLWNRFPFSQIPLDNLLQVNGYVLLAPDAMTETAELPKAHQGDWAWWYGQSDTGSFIGVQSSNDQPLSGGRSVSSHSGELISPAIDLTSVAEPVLRFQTFWEIESVNPNAFGYDWMQVDVRVAGTSTFTQLRRLNPHVDPNDVDRAAKGFSSAGYFREPVWVQEEFDLSPFAGKIVEIRFYFATRDSLYNGFRGWIIDDLYIFENAVGEESYQSSSGYGIYRDETSLSSDFYKTHRQLRLLEEVLLDDQAAEADSREID